MHTPRHPVPGARLLRKRGGAEGSVRCPRQPAGNTDHGKNRHPESVPEPLKRHVCDESPLGRRAPAFFEWLSYDGQRVAPLSHGRPPSEAPRIPGFSSSLHWPRLQHGGVPGTKVVGESPTHVVHFACAVLKMGADIYYGQISRENLHLGLFLKKKWEDVAMPARQLLLRGDGSWLLLELGHALL